MTEPALYVVEIEVDPAFEAEWSAWQDEVHIAAVVAEPGFLRARRYRRADAPGPWAQYVVLYELENMAALRTYLASAACQRLRADHLAHYGHATRLSRMLLEPAGG